MTKKLLSHVSKRNTLKSRAHGKKQNELLHNTSRFLEMESWKLKIHVLRGILCTAHARRAFIIFDRFYLMTHVLSGDGEGVIFISFDSSFMWFAQFVREELFILRIFTL